MFATPNDSRIRTLEARVARLAEFNQILLEHLLRAQDLSGPGKGPSSQDVNRWVIDLSDSVWSKYQYSPKL